MTRKSILSAMVLAVAAFFAINPAGATIIGSKHDFTASGPRKFKSTNDDNQVCIYCHTPHSAVSQDRYGNRVPLWNRSLNEAANNFTMYSSPTFTGTMPTDNKPTGYSLLCLSCHDGISSIGAVLNNFSSGVITVDPSTIGALVYPPYANINIGGDGGDLSNDHPVSFVYDNNLVSRDPGLQNPASINPALKLYGGRLECPTCHDPHEYGSLVNQAPFLRMSNAGSEMCLECHLK